MRKWKADKEIWIESHPKPWNEEIETEFHRVFSLEMDLIMDRGHGSCVLRKPDIRAILEESFRNFDGIRYEMHSWVIMPNHVHILLSMKEGMKLEKVVATWKNYTATRINRVLGLQGQFWQKDYFDRMIRDWEHFSRVARYIRKNPVKAKIRQGEYLLYEDEIVKRVLG